MTTHEKEALRDTQGREIRDTFIRAVDKWISAWDLGVCQEQVAEMGQISRDALTYGFLHDTAWLGMAGMYLGEVLGVAYSRAQDERIMELLGDIGLQAGAMGPQAGARAIEWVTMPLHMKRT